MDGKLAAFSQARQEICQRQLTGAVLALQRWPFTVRGSIRTSASGDFVERRPKRQSITPQLLEVLFDAPGTSLRMKIIPGITLDMSCPIGSPGGPQGEARVHVLKIQFDVNHDGTMDTTFAGPDNTTAESRFVFWHNDDFDRGHKVDCNVLGENCDWEEDDLDLSRSDLTVRVPDHAFEYVLLPGNIRVPGIPSLRDLEDYARMWLPGLPQLLSVLPQGHSVQLRLSGDAEINIYQAAETDGGTRYLTEELTAQDQRDRSITLFVGRLSSSSPLDLHSRPNIGEHFIFCGAKRGKARITMRIQDGNQNVLAETEAFIEIQDIKQMYERWTVGDVPSVPPRTEARIASEDARFEYSRTEPDSSMPYILFVHGWNMERWEKDRFAETAFKRLYWQGYRGRFGTFRWPTYYRFGQFWEEWNNMFTFADHFDKSELNGWRSAVGLRWLLNRLNTLYPGRVYMLAHSTGAIPAGEALRIAPANPPVVAAYITSEGALASHAYDPSRTVRSLGIQDSQTPNAYAQYWLPGSPPYFNSVNAAGNYINFYNPIDYALRIWEFGQNFKPNVGYTYDGVEFRVHVGEDSQALTFPADTYPLFSFCVEARCYAAGAQQGVQGPFQPQNEIPLDTDFAFGSAHKGHSAPFRSTNMKRGPYWNQVLDSFGIPNP